MQPPSCLLNSSQGKEINNMLSQYLQDDLQQERRERSASVLVLRLGDKS